MTATRLPVEPLLELLDPDNTRAAVALGVNVDTIAAWRRGTRLATIHPYRADKYAITLGLHPSEIWGQAWWDAA